MFEIKSLGIFRYEIQFLEFVKENFFKNDKNC